jgi:hypothetical protein
MQTGGRFWANGCCASDAVRGGCCLCKGFYPALHRFIWFSSLKSPMKTSWFIFTLLASTLAGVQAQIAFRAGALTMLVAFWFDGGLFKLATASVFWILLELGAERRFKPRMDTDEHGFWAAKTHKKHKENPDFAAKEHREHKESPDSSPCPSPHPMKRGESLLRFLRFFAAIKSESGNPPSLCFGAANRKSAIDHGLVTSAATR